MPPTASTHPSATNGLEKSPRSPNQCCTPVTAAQAPRAAANLSKSAVLGLSKSWNPVVTAMTNRTNTAASVTTRNVPSSELVAKPKAAALGATASSKSATTSPKAGCCRRSDMIAAATSPRRTSIGLESRRRSVPETAVGWTSSSASSTALRCATPNPALSRAVSAKNRFLESNLHEFTSRLGCATRREASVAAAHRRGSPPSLPPRGQWT
mmetsp:Transcript_20417/g.78481  ORF Transcript_20417/g.78481 Transcript_20417/m.78481 type:complete len:211 (-) Transcript_20417:706-1338(-)